MMDLNPHTCSESPLAARLDRVVAEARPHHRVLFLEHLSDDAFIPWARTKALAEPENVAHLHFYADGRDLVSGVVAGYDVEGDGLDDALRTVLTGRTLVLVAGADAACRRLGEPFLAWLDWAAAHLPLTVACTGHAGRFLPPLRQHAVAVTQFCDAPDGYTAAALDDHAVRTPRKDL
jgi:hypothetical protein